MKSMFWASLVGLGVAIVGGCKDESAEWLRWCEDAEAKGDIGNAWTHCSIAADKGSAAAKAKLDQLKPKYDALKAEEAAKQAEKRAQATKEAEQKRKAEQAVQAARIEALREKVSFRMYGPEPDDECLAKGKPRYRREYTGGLFSENEAVAASDGCVRLFEKHINPGMTDNIFCCPGK